MPQPLKNLTLNILLKLCDVKSVIGYENFERTVAVKEYAIIC